MTRRSIIVATIALPFVLGMIAVVAVLFAAQGGFAPYRIPSGPGSSLAPSATGEYLTRIGDCTACHTTRGGVPFAGGHAFDTVYGTVYSPNISPDREHGIGDWSAQEFKHVMRNGVSRKGTLYPAFPYAHFAHVTDADLDAIHAYLRAQPPSASEPPPNHLEFPASSRTALIAWRMLYYRPSPFPVSGAASDRGQYLVDGLGHCAMCHSTRGARDSLPREGYLAGGLIPGSGWYAPPLDGNALSRYSVTELADYLRTGTSPRGAAYGPMADVIYRSLSALTPEDAIAMAEYLKRLPPHMPRATRADDDARTARTNDGQLNDGAELYKKACADCHGDNGEGKDEHYPPLKDAVSVTAPDPINAVRIVLHGAMAPTTPGNPRPYSMPPFVQQLSSAQVATVVNYIRRDSNPSSALSASDIEAMQGIVLE